MESGSLQIRNRKSNGPQVAVKEGVLLSHRVGCGLLEEGEAAVQRESRIQRMEAVHAHPVAELLECPAAVGAVLNGSAQCLPFRAGEVVFHRSECCRGLYMVVSGRLQRHTEWNQTPETLAPAQAGDLLELSAVLSGGLHSFTLTAQTAASVLLLPMEALKQAFQSFPPLRMRLLEELAREVSRAYFDCCFCRPMRMRRAGSAA